jgi:hypothetical protein
LPHPDSRLRGIARSAATAAASGAALTLGIGLAYLAGEAAAGVSGTPTGLPRLFAAGRTVSAAMAQAPPRVLAELVVLAPQALAHEAMAIDPALLQAAAFRPSSPYQFDSAAGAGRDIDCLTAAVYYEARGEPAAGQAAVAQVVLNRVRNPAFPKSVCGVVYQGVGTRTCQFTFACNGAMGRRTEPEAWDRARDVAQRALDGYVMPDVGHAVAYHTVALGNLWSRSMIQIARVGQHIFYGFMGRALSDDDAPTNAVTPAPASNALAPAAATLAQAIPTPPAAAAPAPQPTPAQVQPASPPPPTPAAS